MGKVKNLMIENEYQNGIIDDIFREYDYQDKKHFLKVRPSREKIPLVRVLDALGCIVLIVAMVSLCLFL